MELKVKELKCLFNGNKLKSGRLQLKFFTIQKGRFLLNMYGKIAVETTERIKRVKKIAN